MDVCSSRDFETDSFVRVIILLLRVNVLQCSCFGRYYGLLWEGGKCMCVQ
jgi:hypothetical protein